MYNNLKIRNIIFDTDAVTIICEMNDEIRHIIISNYEFEEIVLRLENGRYYNDIVIDLFCANLKLRVLEAFYATQIYSKDS